MSATLAAEVDHAAARLEDAGAVEVVAWAAERFGDRLVVACSFEDCVLVDVVTRAAPDVEVVLLDTGFLFPETLAFVDAVRHRYDLNLTVLRPDLAPNAHPCGTERCCELRKVAPLEQALADADAWVTGLRRADGPTRAGISVVEWDAARGLVKLNPLAAWSDADLAGYVADRGLPVHPLAAHGYRSIGCWPTTEPVGDGDDPRAGRWAGTAKTECGLHV